MSLKPLWPGRDEDVSTLLLIPPAGLASWTNPSTGFQWPRDGIHGHLASNPIYVFEHEATSSTAILTSSQTLARLLSDLRKSNAKLSRRPWLIIGHGSGGTLAKALLATDDFAEKCTVGLLLLDTPNLGSFATYETLLAATKHFGWPTPATDADHVSLKKLRDLEAKLVGVSSRVFPVVSGFSIQSNFGRTNIHLNLPNESTYCMKTSSNRVGIYDDKQDNTFVALALAIKRAASNTKTGAKRSLRPTSAGWTADVKARLNKYFPPYNQYKLSLHHVKSFSRPGSNGDPSIETQIRSKVVSMPDLGRLVDSSDDYLNPSDFSQAISLRWFHVPANHTAWIEYMMMQFEKATTIPKHTFLDFWPRNAQLAKSLRLGSWQVNSTCTFVSPYGDTANTETAGLVIIMPYLHWDTTDYLSGREKAIDALKSDNITQSEISPYHALAASQAFATGQPNLTPTSFSNPMMIGNSSSYIPQLLDQYKYPTISLPSNRIQTQLLPKLTQTSSTGSKALMVQQLWLIVPNDRDVLTYFPSKEPDSTSTEVSQVSDVENVVLDILTNIHHPSDACSGIYDIAALIVHATATTLLGQTKHPDFQFISLYRVAVGELRMKYLAALLQFKDESLRNTSTNIAQDASEENYELSLIVEAHAIKDELQTLSELIQAQAGIVEKFKKHITSQDEEVVSTGTTAEALLKDAEGMLAGFEAEFKNLREDAVAVERDLLRLLDLRQKRANLQAAHAARLQAQETSNQTEHSLSLSQSAASQSRIVLIFTLLTSIYLPLSFFSSYYGMNVKDITGDDGNPNTLDDYWKVAGPISVVATLIALFVGVRENLEEWWKKWHKKSSQDDAKVTSTINATV